MTAFTVRKWQALPSGNVAAHVCDEHGHVTVVTMPRNQSTADNAHAIIGHALALRPRKPVARP